MNMYTQSLYNKNIYNSERNFKPKLNSYNIKIQINFIQMHMVHPMNTEK